MGQPMRISGKTKQVEPSLLLQGLAKRSRPVHGARAKLAYDLTALLSCARPCVMLGLC